MSQPAEHPIVKRGVWILPATTPEGLSIAFAVSSAGVQVKMIAFDRDDPEAWESAYQQLSELLDRVDPVADTPEPEPDYAAEVERALAVVSSGANLPEEQGAIHWVGEIHNGRRGQVSYRTYKLWRRKHRRTVARRNREIMAAVPVPCRGCGEPFIRTRNLQQCRCQSCIDASKAHGGR
jgi:hypothetical protein